MLAADLPQFSYLQRIWALRFFWFSLVRNDLRSRYRRSILGVGWSLLRPLGMTAVFCLVFGTMFQRDIRSYAPYVLLGMTTWQFLYESMMQGCYTFLIGSAYIRQQQVPHAIFPLRTVLGSGFHFLVALSLGVVMTGYLQGIPSALPLLVLPAVMLLLFVLGWSLAIITGVLSTHFPDSHHLLEIVLQILFYVTPIMYDPQDLPQRYALMKVLHWNPVNALLELIRAPLLRGALPSEHSLVVSLTFTAGAALLAWMLLRKLEKRLVFWL